jgi:hypothetical protein
MQTPDTIIRQGDLTFIRVSDDKAGSVTEAYKASQNPSRITVLALGESSGHCHECEEAIGEWILDDERFLVVEQETRVVINPLAQRGRHAPVNLEPGVYLVPGMSDLLSKWIGQREYSPEAVRGVTD